MVIIDVRNLASIQAVDSPFFRVNALSVQSCRLLNYTNTDFFGRFLCFRWFLLMEKL